MSKYIPKDKVKDALIKKTAIKTLTSESIVEKIINFQGKDASKAVKFYNEVEFSGFGKIIVSQRKLAGRIERLERAVDFITKELDASSEEQKKNLLKEKLISIGEAIKILKTKIRVDENKRNNRGIQEQICPEGGDEGVNPEGLLGQINHM